MTWKVFLVVLMAITINTDHILLVVDNVQLKQTHSQFMDMLSQ